MSGDEPVHTLRVVGSVVKRSTEPSPILVGELISPRGRIAGLTTAVCVALAGAAYSIAAGRVLTCPRPRDCQVNPSYGALFLFATVPITIGAVVLTRKIARRPVHQEGGSGWMWGLGFLFAVGLAVASTRIPRVTCPEGKHLDPIFSMCIGSDPAHRGDAESWGWLRMVLLVAAVVGGLAIAKLKRGVVFLAVVAGGVWILGLGLLLRHTLAPNLFR